MAIPATNLRQAGPFARSFRPLALILSVAILAIGCSSTPVANRNPVGEPFPPVTGESLAGDSWQIPGDLAGKPAVILVGLVQDSQFDIDRWLLGLVQAETPVPFLELPTIRGLAPRMFQGQIDEGMRKGIPPEDWQGVITIWGEDAKKVVQLTGNELPRNARVALLDSEGVIVWFADRGYSAQNMVELDSKARQLLGMAGEGAEDTGAPAGDPGSGPAAAGPEPAETE